MKKTFTWEIAIDLSALTKALSLAELAKAIKVTADKIIKWREFKGRILASVSGKGGRFVGFWQLETSIKWIVRALATWACAKTWPYLRQAICNGLKRYRYAPESGEIIKRALRQKEAYFARQKSCHRWANWLINKINQCENLQTLKEIEQLFWQQRRLYEAYSSEIEKVLIAIKQKNRNLMQLATTA
ncbi:MAG: hypothetical protein N3E45_00935 [Oscillatoriaceae bacterium SKW80]|nr:hypothetical protein [Oscillatoriaceae bacterium SKYG93]MCX8119394.1 hypothetical protein [Oscillatoriaceae bacterium SKW80]MDW8454861.1 hypothetical protein [Oscillatoriaceae cyanobacterium SKYGB_i_bin93]HIK28360.1 hypothetical protein [Oscillatoriaceae cyanobacterium M7585_C2015_266]